MNPKKQLTRRQKALRDNLVPVALLFFILIIACAVTWIITEPMLHPNLHPRMVRLGYEIIHHHPRLLKCFQLASIFTLVVLYTSPLWRLMAFKYLWRKKGLLSKPQAKASSLFDRSVKENVTMDTPAAWQHLQSLLSGLLIKVPCLRPAHWEVVEVNERFQQIKAVLTYVHDPLGLQPSRLYPRTVMCTATVSGTGIKSQVQLSYRTKSAMDFRNVCAIVDQTNTAIRESLKNDSQLKAMLAREAGLRAKGRYPAGESNGEEGGNGETDFVDVVSSTLEVDAVKPNPAENPTGTENPIPEYKFYMPV